MIIARLKSDQQGSQQAVKTPDARRDVTTRGLLVAVGAYVMLLAACVSLSPSTQQQASIEGLVVRFHALYNEGKFVAIYQEANDQVRSTCPEDEYTHTMSTIRSKLGKQLTSKQRSWNMRRGNAGTTINVSYDTTFESGKGMETFSILFNDGAGSLIGYTVTSNILVGEDLTPPAIQNRAGGSLGSGLQ
jgi:hypothetical protein